MNQLVGLLSASLVRPFILAAVAGLVLGTFRVRHPASRHAIWTAVLVGMLVLPFLSISTPHWNAPVLPPRAESIIPQPAYQTLFRTPTVREGSIARPDPSLEIRSAPKPIAIPLPLYLYVVGLLAMILYRLTGWILLRRLITRSSPIRAHLRESIDTTVPLAAGLLHPVVILPADWRTWDRPTRRAVLSHEFAHIRRRDALVSSLARAVKCVLWFHPLAWWLSRTIGQLAELACDAAALERMGDPGRYSRILLAFASSVNRAGYRVTLPALTMANSSVLGKRIDQIFDLTTGNLRRLSRPGVALAFLGVPALCIAAVVGLTESKVRVTQVSTPLTAARVVTPLIAQAQFAPQRAKPGAPNKNLVGTWQGLITVMAPDTRIVIKISTTLAGTLRGDLYSIDFGGHSPATDVTLKGSDVKIVIPSISGTYLGKMSADGKSITGIMKGRADDQPLNLTRATAETAWKFPEPRKPKMMPGDADPAFEVATVKPTNPDARGRGGKGFVLRGRQFSWINTSIGDLITLAYAIHPRQIVGAPDWVEKDRYDLMGEPDVEGQPNNRQEMGLIQKLLADRFSLRVHHEKRELSVYVIVIGKSGAKLSKAEDDPKAAGLTRAFPWEPSVFRMSPSSFFAQSATIADFVRYLVQGEIFDRPVVDRTGLTGQYEFALSWRPEAAQVGGNNPPPPSELDFLPDISTAFQQQLGLRLEATKTPTDVIVIDHVEKPSEN